MRELDATTANVASPPDDVVRPVGGPDDLRGDEDDVQQVAQEEEAKRRELRVNVWTLIQGSFCKLNLS